MSLEFCHYSKFVSRKTNISWKKSRKDQSLSHKKWHLRWQKKKSREREKQTTSDLSEKQVSNTLHFYPNPEWRTKEEHNSSASLSQWKKKKKNRKKKFENQFVRIVFSIIFYLNISFYVSIYLYQSIVFPSCCIVLYIYIFISGHLFKYWPSSS